MSPKRDSIALELLSVGDDGIQLLAKNDGVRPGVISQARLRIPQDALARVGFSVAELRIEGLPVIPPDQLSVLPLRCDTPLPRQARAYDDAKKATLEVTIRHHDGTTSVTSIEFWASMK